MTIIIRGEKSVSEFVGVSQRMASAIERILLEHERARFADIRAWQGTVESYEKKEKGVIR